VITGDEDARPEVRILLDLLAEASERAGAATLRRWLRANEEKPLRLLLSHDFAGFEDALADLEARGFILRSG
jgi:hypothetical protein